MRNILTVILLFNVYGSVEHSGGQRVRLDVQRLKQFSVFPGQVRKKKRKIKVVLLLMSILLIKYPVLFQVVGIEGNNPSGHCLSAAKIIDSIPLPSPADVSLPPSKKQAVDQDTISPDSSSLPEELSVVSKFDLSC